MTRSPINNNKDEHIIIEYDDTTRAWNDWKHGNIIQKSFVHERYIISLVECTKKYVTYKNSFEKSDQLTSSKTINIPSLVRIPPEININCHICEKSQGQLYPCRICGKVYHQQCIKDIGNTKSYYLIKNATNLIGWSCPICEDLRILLPSKELTETNEWIKSLGKQTIFSLDHYINIRIKSKSSVSFDVNELNDRMKTILQIFLNTITGITSNHLSQIDLFILDVSLKILRISPIYLVNSLTLFELYRLSQIFISLSSYDNQYITYRKFQQVFNTYLLITMSEINSDERQLHLEALAYSILGNMIKFDQTWSQFVLNATIPTLLQRYNYRTSSDFINQIISIEQSTSPTTANFIKYIDNQSLTILINDILEKLKQTVGNETKTTKDKYRTKYAKKIKKMNI